MATKRKLKPAFRDLHGEEIRKLREELGEDNVTEEVHTCLLAYSGDTPVEDLSRWNNCKVLIHEATFLEEEADSLVHPRSSKHSKLEEVISMVSNLNIEKLVLGHFSSRYSAQQIDNAIRSLCAKYSIHIPVFRVLPGETVHHILEGQAING